jgi:RNA polymerase sigma-70 factor (ECF subfamily)
MPAPDPESLAGLYDRLGASLFRYALMILTDRASAEDVVHDVFAELARTGTSQIDHVDAYLRQAVRHRCYSLLRTRGRTTPMDEAPLLEPIVAGVSAEERLALDGALRALPDDQREVVHLKLYEGLTFQEIATLSDESINTVAARYRYAVEKMRATLDVASPRRVRRMSEKNQ